MKGKYAVTVNGNWRVVFKFLGKEPLMLTALIIIKEIAYEGYAQSTTPWSFALSH